MATSTRYVGFCPVCEGTFKVRSGALVHHGYQRPGIGFIVGDCPGVGYPPFETSPAAAEAYLRNQVLPAAETALAALAVLASPDGPPWLLFERYDIEARRVVYAPRTGKPETVRLTRPEAAALAAQLPSWDQHRYSWERALGIARAAADSELRFWERERVRLVSLIAAWAPRPLVTVEEEVAHQTQARAERSASAQRKREDKMAAAVVAMQKRLDSAVRNRSPGPLREIFGSNKLRELSGYQITKADAIALLDRDDVWRAFGLLTEAGYALDEDHPARRRLDDMYYQFGGRPVPDWPEALGGGQPKRSRQ